MAAVKIMNNNCKKKFRLCVISHNGSYKSRQNKEEEEEEEKEKEKEKRKKKKKKKKIDA